MSGAYDFTGATPQAVGEEATWYEHCRRGELMIQRCASCGHHQFPPRSVCKECLTEDPEWTEAAGTGAVFTFTIQHRDAPGFAGQAPYVIAVVALTEGPRLLSRLMVEPEHARIGMPVTVAWARAGEDLRVPVFVPAGSADGG